MSKWSLASTKQSQYNIMNVQTASPTSYCSLDVVAQVKCLSWSRGIHTVWKLSNDESALEFNWTDDSLHGTTTLHLRSSSIWLWVRMLPTNFNSFSALRARSFQLLHSFAFLSVICAKIITIIITDVCKDY